MHLLGQRQHIYKKVLNLSKRMGCTKMCYVQCVCVLYTCDGWLPEPIIGGRRQEPWRSWPADRTRIYQFGTDWKEVGLDGVTHWTPRNGLGPSWTSRVYKGIAQRNDTDWVYFIMCTYVLINFQNHYGVKGHWEMYLWITGLRINSSLWPRYPLANAQMHYPRGWIK